MTTTREIRVNDVEMAKKLLEGLQSRAETPNPVARIDVVQIDVDEQPVKRMQELPTPLETSTPQAAQIKTSVPRFLQTLASTFTSKLEQIVILQRLLNLARYNEMPESPVVIRFWLDLETLRSSGGSNATLIPTPSSSGARSEGGTSSLETPTTAARMAWPLTRSATKQTSKGIAPAFMKRPILILVKGSSSKRSKN